jgi:hypothetical protein
MTGGTTGLTTEHTKQTEAGTAEDADFAEDADAVCKPAGGR